MGILSIALFASSLVGQLALLPTVPLMRGAFTLDSLPFCGGNKVVSVSMIALNSVG